MVCRLNHNANNKIVTKKSNKINHVSMAAGVCSDCGQMRWAVAGVELL